jgi:hypothetical protein
LLLDDEEAVAVAIGLRTATAGAVTGIEETSLRALVKLEQVLPSHLRRRVQALQAATTTLSYEGGPSADPQALTLIAAAWLRERGFEVAVADITLAESPDAAFRAALEKHRPKLVAVVEDSFNFLTKMCTTVNREMAFHMAAAASEAGVATGATVSGTLPAAIVGVYQPVVNGTATTKPDLASSVASQVMP